MGATGIDWLCLGIYKHVETC